AELSPRKVWQPIQDYNAVVDPIGKGRQGMDATQRINQFLSYTSIGTDFGFHGPGQAGLGWEPGSICLVLPDNSWGGIWHSLSRLAVNLEDSLNFQECYPSFIQPAWQPKIIGLRWKGYGRGTVKFEVKAAVGE